MEGKGLRWKEVKSWLGGFNWSSGMNVSQGKFSLHIRKIFLTTRSITTWNGSPQGKGGSWLDKAMKNTLWGATFKQLGNGPSDLSAFSISNFSDSIIARVQCRVHDSCSLPRQCCLGTPPTKPVLRMQRTPELWPPAFFTEVYQAQAALTGTFGYRGTRGFMSSGHF